jgi:hypothetical protein
MEALFCKVANNFCVAENFISTGRRIGIGAAGRMGFLRAPVYTLLKRTEIALQSTCDKVGSGFAIANAGVASCRQFRAGARR